MRTMMKARSAAGSWGFTLIELLSVVLIIAVLAAIAFPSYTRQVQKSRRTDGHTLLMRIAAEQERYYTNFNRYTADLTGAPPAGLGLSQITSENRFYTATAVVANANQTYQLTATPVGTQAVDYCGALTLSSSDQRTFAGNQDNGNCW
jgi:type IV pilus assembly protein PilE